ncbi:MAG: lysyl oxidase family protein [Planctomycetia bacterium]
MLQPAPPPTRSWRRSRRPLQGLAMRVATAVGCALLLACGGGSAPPFDDAGGLLLRDGRTKGSVDFTVDPTRLQASARVIDRTFGSSECPVVEGTIEVSGKRRLLIFDTLVVNQGELDCVIGSPANPQPPLSPSAFTYHDCHGHYHMAGYAAYELRLPDGSLAAVGNKQGFCLVDFQRVMGAGGVTGQYTCAFQGLQSGWADLYSANVEGQWVDVTGLPGGSYLLRVTINSLGLIPEVVDYYPNTIEVAVTLPDPSTTVEQGDDHGNQQGAATPLAWPIGLLADIDPVGDSDWFRTSVTQGSSYVFRTELLTLPDSTLRMLAADGTVLASSDNVSPSDLSSRIAWTSTFTGTVWLEVKGKTGQTGGYRMVIE